MSADVWKFGGTTLTTLGIITKLSDALGLPARRGENQLVPLRDGRTWVRKYYDQRVIQLGMALTEASAAALETKIDTIKTLCGKSTQQVLEVTMEDGSIRQAYAEVDGGIDVARYSGGVAKLVIPFTLSEPFMRKSTAITDTQTINASPKTYTLANPGTADECTAIITLTGPLNYPGITNTTNAVYVGYNAVIGAGHYVVINCALFTAIDEVGNNVIGNVVHSGDTAFLALLPGNNAISVVDLTHTTGTVKIEFYPPYL